MDTRPPRGDGKILIQDFNLENYLSERVDGNITVGEYYKQRLDTLQSLIEGTGLALKLDNFDVEKLEDLFYCMVKGTRPLEEYIKRNKPANMPILDYQTCKRVTWAFTFLAVDRYLAGSLAP